MIDWLACEVVRVLSWLLRGMPPSAAIWLGEQIGALGMWLQPARTRIGLTNLRAAFDGRLTPAAARRIIRSLYRNLAASVVELLRLPATDQAYVERYVTIEGRRHFEAAVASGKPLILLAGHYGNWELSSIVAALLGYPIAALARAQNKFPRLYALLVAYRESKGCSIIHKGNAMRQLVSALQAKRPIGIVGDQASRQGLFVEFFGRPALFATGSFELAWRYGATILPVLTHRVRGPFHRVVIEPPITLDRASGRAHAVRDGVEQFARVLARHIAEDPTQWLWLHKRWKHTPARRLLVLSDGKLGHLKQALAVADALREGHPQSSVHVAEIRFRHAAGRLFALLWSWWMPPGLGGSWCLERALDEATRVNLLTRSADAVISCGAAAAPVNLLWAGEQRAKSIVIMNPAPLPLRRFHLIIAPRHDRLPRRPNIVHISGALTARVPEEALTRARQHLEAHPRFTPYHGSPARGTGDAVPHPHPVIAVFLGGDTAYCTFTPNVAATLIGQIQSACSAMDGWYLVTTSRRTPASVEQWLSEHVRQDPRCRLLLLASQDALNGTMEGMLGSADAAVVTGESVSMVSEACASGRRVVVVEIPPRRARHGSLRRHRRFLRDLLAEGYIRLPKLTELGSSLTHLLAERAEPKRLDDVAAIRHALARLW